jgi:non-ribosomal peptide synthetase component F/aryl carrier-like protein
LKISASSIGLDDNFFQVGGDSIGAIKLVGEARRQGITLSVAQIFQNPILSDLAQTLLEAKVDDKESNDKGHIVPFSLLPTDANSDIARCLGEAACLCDATVDDVEDAYPCTPLQEGLLSLTAKNSNNFVMQRVLELGTEMDAQRFKEAWHEVIRSTPILRTRIVQHPELGFLQVVFKEASWATANTLEDYLEKDKCHVMGVGVALARFALIQDQQKTCFALTCHHALYDGWSLPLIENKLATAYMSSKDALLTKGPGFNSFLKYTLQNDKQATEEFWKASLAGFEGSAFPPVLSMTKAMKAYAKIDRVYALPPSKIRGITPGTIIRGAWALSVQRWTGTEEDVVFGSTVSGRNAPVSGIESIAGPTIATVPVRVRVSGSSSLSSYLQAIQSQAIAMIPHEQIGLQYLAKISPEAQLACDFRTLLVVQPSETDDDGSYSLGTWRDISEAAAFAAYPLTLICQLCADGNVRLSAVHDPRAIDGWRLERLLDQFEMAIQQLTEPHQDQLLEGLNILSPNDSKILWSWNKNVPVAAKSCVHELIQQNALENSSAMAVDAWDGQLSNSELDRLSTTLAKHLIRHCSVQPGTTIPLYFEKSMWIIVSILGVLKAGCNFLMIDPAQASDRRKHILRQVDATIILASETYKEVAAEVCNEVVAVASSFDSVREQIDDTECLPSAKLSDTCYIMYTSGSTGYPKGIVVTHEALASSTLHHGRRAGLNETTRILQFASYSFDACILELITSLVFGGRICIPSDEDRLDIAKSITSFSANTAFFTPTVARLVNPQMVPTLRTLILGGEAVSIEDFQRWSHLDRLQNGKPTLFSHKSARAQGSPRTQKQHVRNM